MAASRLISLGGAAGLPSGRTSRGHPTFETGPIKQVRPLTGRHPYSETAAANEVHLRILSTTDLHAFLFPYDYFTDRPDDGYGLTRTASLIDGLRAGAANSLTVDNGDFLQGNPLGDYVAYETGLGKGRVHPVIAAMNAVGYDAATLGNHEFNYGLDFLERSIEGAAFPVVTANVMKLPGRTGMAKAPLYPPYVILDRQVMDGAGQSRALKIGIIGFLPPQIMTWDCRLLKGRIETLGIVESAKALVPQMKAEGSDLIIALAHTGIDADLEDDAIEDAAVPLAAVDGIDVIVTGHGHQIFPSTEFTRTQFVDPEQGTIHGKPAVMAGFGGSHAGMIDLLLSQAPGLGWAILSFSAETRAIATRDAARATIPTVKDHPAVSAAAQTGHLGTLDYIRRPVGQSATAVHSYFALVGPDRSIQIVADAQRWFIRQALNGTPEGELPLLSAAAPFKAGGRGGPENYTFIPPGDLALRHVADLYLYPNTIRALKITGTQLTDWLERAAGLFRHVAPGSQDAPLISTDVPSYNFDVIAGVTYRIDLSQPAKYDSYGRLANPKARRIRDLCHNGMPVEPDMPFIVATNSYRASGGGQFPGTGPTQMIFDSPITNRDIVMRYIATRPAVDPPASPGWQFTPMPGTSVLFDTSPHAMGFLHDLDSLEIETLDRTPQGFLRLRIRL